MSSIEELRDKNRAKMINMLQVEFKNDFSDIIEQFNELKKKKTKPKRTKSTDSPYASKLRGFVPGERKSARLANKPPEMSAVSLSELEILDHAIAKMCSWKSRQISQPRSDIKVIKKIKRPYKGGIKVFDSDSDEDQGEYNSPIRNKEVGKTSHEGIQVFDSDEDS